MRREIFRQARRQILGRAVDSDPLRKPNQGRTEQGVFGNIDLFAARQPRLERLGQHSAAGKPAMSCMRVSEQRSAPP